MGWSEFPVAYGIVILIPSGLLGIDLILPHNLRQNAETPAIIGVNVFSESYIMHIMRHQGLEPLYTLGYKGTRIFHTYFPYGYWVVNVLRNIDLCSPCIHWVTDILIIYDGSKKSLKIGLELRGEVESSRTPIY